MAVEAHHLLPFSLQFLFDRELIKVADPQPPELGGDAFVATTVTACRKRPRDPVTFHSDELSSHVFHDMLHLDRLLIDHNESVREEFNHRRQRFTQHLMVAVEEGIRKRLKAKDNEIERAKRINSRLEERFRNLAMETRIWRDLAETNEANANLLRTNLEKLLASALAGVDDAESCCVGESEEMKMAGVGRMRACRNCGEAAAAVLLLPCRHLCLCVACGRGVNLCPVCKCSKTGSVNVNLY